MAAVLISFLLTLYFVVGKDPYPQNTEVCDIPVTTVYPQVFLGSRLSADLRGRMKSWVDYMLTVSAGIRTQASRYVGVVISSLWMCPLFSESRLLI